MSNKPTYEQLEQKVKALEVEIKEQRKRENVLQEREARYNALFDRLLDCVYLHDLEGNFVDANPAALDLIGYNKEEIPSVNFATLLSPDQFSNAMQVLEEVKKLGYDTKLREFRLKDKYGNYVWVEAKSSMIYRDEKPFLIQGIARDITGRKRAEEEIKRTHEKLEETNRRFQELATFDSTTGLANRRKFDEILNLTWHQCMRYQKPVSIIMIDIDHFKEYNDTYGHQLGDDCLKQVANIMNNSNFARRAGDLIARYGGEEFAVILHDYNEKYAAKISETICLEVRDKKLSHKGSKVMGMNVVTVSAGVATEIPEKASVPEELVSKADKALYRAKEKGRNRFEIFNG